MNSYSIFTILKSKMTKGSFIHSILPEQFIKVAQILILPIKKMHLKKLMLQKKLKVTKVLINKMNLKLKKGSKLTLQARKLKNPRTKRLI